MLATNMAGVTAALNTPTVICEWVSDGNGSIIGFTGTGTYSGEFRLNIVEVDDAGAEIRTVGYYMYYTSPMNRTAYIADRAFTIPAGHKARLTVQHDSVDNQTFYGTILGGTY